MRSRTWNIFVVLLQLRSLHSTEWDGKDDQEWCRGNGVKGVLGQFPGVVSAFKREGSWGKPWKTSVRTATNNPKYNTILFMLHQTAMESRNKWINKQKMKQILSCLIQPEQVFQCAVVMVLLSNVVTFGKNFCHYLVGKISHSNSVLP